MRKTIFLQVSLLLIFLSANAQLGKLVSPPTAFSENLAKVAQAFQNNYYQIQAEQLPSQEDMDVYKSAVSLPGSQHCVIYRFHSKTDTAASWQALMYDGESYKEALKAYKNSCKMIDRCRVSISNGNSATFKGKMEEPDPNLRFASSVYKLNTSEAVYEKFYAEVELLNTGIEQWEVHVSLQSKKDDEDEK